MTVDVKFLGKGIKFPFQLTGRTGGVKSEGEVQITEGVRHVTESIQQILGTRIGERVMRRDFGSRVQELVFEPNDEILVARLRGIIFEAIERWEPRIEVLEVNVEELDTDAGRLDVFISFRVIRQNVVGNLVFPFFLAKEQLIPTS